MLKSFKSGFSLPITSEWLKELFKVISKAMFGKISTAKLTTAEIQKVYEAYDMAISQKTGVSVVWPSNEPPAYEGAYER